MALEDALLGKLNVVTGVLGQVSNAFLDIVSKASSFVSALNPALIEAMNFAFRDFQATIGQALTPIISTATQVSRTLGAVLNPLMQALQPIVARLTQAFRTLFEQALGGQGRVWAALIPLADALMKVVEALMPLARLFLSFQSIAQQILIGVLRHLSVSLSLLAVPLKMLADLLSATSPLYEAVGLALAGLQEVVFGLINGVLKALDVDQFKDIFSQLRDGFGQVAKFAILAAASLAQFLGFGEDFIKGVTGALAGPQRVDNTGKAAIQTTAFSSFADFGKTVSLAASKAGQGDPTKDREAKEDAWRKELLGELNKLKAGQQTALDKAVERLVEGLSKAMAKEAERLRDQGYDRTKQAALGSLSAITLAGVRIK